MDNLVLIRVAAVLDVALRRAVLRDLREEPPHRWRLFFEKNDQRISVLVSLRPELPWIGRPSVRWEGGHRDSGPFRALSARSLVGGVVERLDKMGADRAVALRFAGGSALVAELATHRANLVLLDASGRFVGSARHRRSEHSRMVPGEPYRPPPLPAGKLVPFSRTSEEIDRFLHEAMTGGGEILEVLRRCVFGIGSEGAALVVSESLRTGKTLGTVLAEKLAALSDGRLDPVVEASSEDLLPSSLRLLPWDPGPPSPHGLRRGADAAATAGLYYDALEGAAWERARGEALVAILRGELQRLEGAEEKVSGDIACFERPEKHRLWGEALLAGLTRARRTGDSAIVADPYDVEGREMVVPAPAALPLAAAAEQHFRQYRRARRGLESAQRRLEWIRSRREKLEEMSARYPELRGAEELARLGEEMRRQGIPVGLEPMTRSARAAARSARPRLEGVRIFMSGDGLQILVGRTGRDNDRLTFKLASPQDFWFHAMRVPGAHVVVRNPRREPRPPRATLAEAASMAAWYSDARGQDPAEVQWTQRKNVRRVRGAASGTVTLKRFETVRVRPALPFDEQEQSQ